MTLKIALSFVKSLPFDFENEVASFVKAKQDHRSTTGEAAPSAPHRLVEDAVRRVPGSIAEQKPDDFVADYEIVDDTPPPAAPPTLDQRKLTMAAELGVQANAAIAAIIPPLKQRLWDREHARVLADMGKVKPQENETVEAWRTRAIEVVKKNSPADHVSFTEHEDRKKKVDAIIHHVAVCESQIHDLTEVDLDNWKPKPFPA
jgi:hypothetical protein